VDRLLAAKSEGVGLIVCAIRFQDFQPMWSQITSVTDGRTDRRHAIPRPRICTKVHCAVKIIKKTTKNCYRRKIIVMEQKLMKYSDSADTVTKQIYQTIQQESIMPRQSPLTYGKTWHTTTNVIAFTYKIFCSTTRWKWHRLSTGSREQNSPVDNIINHHSGGCWY